MFQTEFFLMLNSGDAYLRKLTQSEYGPFAPIYYKPHRTIKHLAALLREADANAEQSLAKMKLPYGRMIDARGAGPYNYSGNELASGLMFRYLLTRARKLDADFATTRAALALAGYANQHDGKLPETLEELAPEYIEAIPLDPMDGEPLRYDNVARKVWSIGRDLTDEGGLPLELGGRKDPHDIVVEIPSPEEEEVTPR